jgi:hypothetical protein
MNALVLDAGALIAAERGDRVVTAALAIQIRQGSTIRTNGNVVAQVWRDRSGRQATLARLLRSVEVADIDESAGRRAGELLAAAGTSDVVDATLALLVTDGDLVMTSDRADIAHLLDTRAAIAAIVDC